MPLAYILLTYGPRHGLALGRHPAAQVQIRHIKDQLPSDHAIKWNYDYARRIGGIEDLPTLQELLQMMSKPDVRMPLLMSDLTVLFKNATPEGRSSLIDALDPCADRIVDLSRGARLSKMPQQMVSLIIQHGALRHMSRNPTSRALPAGTAKSDTARASQMSRRVRGRKADQKAGDLRKIYDEMTCRFGTAPTMTALAQEANRRGVLTTRNKPWSPSTAGRALRRFESTP